jgi:type IV pilus assembly protein PilC
VNILNKKNDIKKQSDKIRDAWEKPINDRELSEIDSKIITGIEKFKRKKLKNKDVLWVLERLATTESAGMPIYRALGALAKMQKNSLIGERLREIQDMMSEGKTLATAMATREKEWGELTVALISAGEASGGLDTSIKKAASELESKQRLMKKVKGALFYPGAVLAITILLVSALLLFVVPKFESIYGDMGSTLPTITKVVLTLSDKAGLFFTILAILLSIIFFMIKKWRKSEVGALKFDQIKIKLPLVGKLFEKSSVARLASTLSALLGAGVPLLECLKYASISVGLKTHEVALLKARERVTDGIPLAVALHETGVFPELMIQLITVGSETGALPEMMAKYSESALDELNESAESLTTLIEPLMMVVIGGIVGIFLVALYLPVLDISSKI